jgi:hypothetical protein
MNKDCPDCGGNCESCVIDDDAFIEWICNETVTCLEDDSKVKKENEAE